MIGLKQDRDEEASKRLDERVELRTKTKYKLKIGKAENRCLSVLTDGRGGLKRTT